MAGRWTVGVGGEINLHMEKGHSPKDEFNGYIATLVPTGVYTYSIEIVYLWFVGAKEA